MNVGELKAALRDIPDDFEIRVELDDKTCPDRYHWAKDVEYSAYVYDRTVWLGGRAYVQDQ